MRLREGEQVSSLAPVIGADEDDADELIEAALVTSAQDEVSALVDEDTSQDDTSQDETA
jgi:hypothetical protein